MMTALGTALLLALAWLAAANLLLAAVAALAGRLVLGSKLSQSQSILLAVRLAPAVGAVAFVGAWFLPAHWRFEPADARESFGVLVWLLGVVGAALMTRATYRALRILHAGWGLRACSTLRELRPWERAWEVPGLNGVSLAGVVRTRVLVGSTVRQTLTDAELEVAVAHEIAHRRALDNLKRFALLCVPDLFAYSSVARQLELCWRAAAERLADARAVAGDPGRAVNLASALVKVSRLGAQTHVRTSPAWSTLHDPPLIEGRVRSLVAAATPSAPGPRRAAGAAVATCAAAILLALALTPSPTVHHVTEALVRILP